MRRVFFLLLWGCGILLGSELSLSLQIEGKYRDWEVLGKNLKTTAVLGTGETEIENGSIEKELVLELWCNGHLLVTEKNTTAWETEVNQEDWQEGLYVLQAICRRGEEKIAESREEIYYFSLYARDLIPPELTFEVDSPFGSRLEITAEDRGAMASLSVSCGEQKLAERVETSGEKRISLTLEGMTLEQWLQGILIEAVDQAGNHVTRLLQRQALDSKTEVDIPTLELYSEIFADEAETTGDVELCLRSRQEIVRYQVVLNQQQVFTVDFSEENQPVFLVLSQEYLQEGENQLVYSCWNHFGVQSVEKSCSFVWGGKAEQSLATEDEAGDSEPEEELEIQVDFPQEEQFVESRILHVQGKVTDLLNDQVKIIPTVSLYDEKGNVCIVPEKTPQEGELAQFDLSSVANGRYCLKLQASRNGRSGEAERWFYLSAKDKRGYLSFLEKDFKFTAAGVSQKYGRGYNTLLADQNHGYGYGWSQSLDWIQPEIEESRRAVEGIDGTQTTVRTGGSRNVTVTLRSGKRVTFLFSLVARGGLNFCYEAKWSAPAGVSATLIPTCSNQLMTVLNLEPYWAASGPETPWEQFDFPGFILTDEDGSRCELTAPVDGEITLLDEDGSTSYLVTRKNLQVSQIQQSDGSWIRFVGENVEYCASGEETWRPLVTFVRDAEAGLVTEMICQGNSPLHIQFIYDQRKNLIQQLRGDAGGELEVWRSYEYGDLRYPHHLTALRDGEGTLLRKCSYDQWGRLERDWRLDAGEKHCSLEGFEGVASTRDETGRTTVEYLDEQGNLLAMELPGNRKISYQYDEAGRETQRISAAGRVTRSQYDEQGNLAVQTDGVGGRTEYLRDSAGRVTSVILPDGKVLVYGYDANGRIISVMNSTGRLFSVERDSSGRMTRLSVEGEGSNWYIYGKNGILLSEGNDLGCCCEYSYDAAGRRTLMKNLGFNDETGELIQQEISYGYDEKGHLASVSDSMGNWASYGYVETAEGEELLQSLEDSAGKQLLFWYDGEGRLLLKQRIQKTDGEETVILQRNCYDGAGRILFTGIVEEKEAERREDVSEIVQFDGGRRYEYDAAGNCVAEYLLVSPKISNGKYAGATEETLIRQCTYDADGYLLTDQTEEDGCWTYEYDGAGRRTVQISPAGGRTLTVYDAGGRVVQQVNPDGNWRSFRYDEIGYPSAVIAEDGSIFRIEYDCRGRLIAQADESGLVTQVLYGTDGNQILQSALSPLTEEGEVPCWNYQYDEAGIMQKWIDPLLLSQNRQNSRYFQWLSVPENSEWNQLVWTVKNLQSQRQFQVRKFCGMEVNSGDFIIEKNWRGSPIVIRRPDETRRELGYDSRGRLVLEKEVDREGQTVWEKKLERGVRGELLSEEQIFHQKGDWRRRSWKYDRWGRMTDEQSCYQTAKGELQQKTVSYQYDLSGHLLQERDKDGAKRIFTYDEKGRLTQCQEENATGQCVSSAYFQWDDVTGELLRVWEERVGEEQVETQFQWENGRTGVARRRLTSATMKKGEKQRKILYFYDEETGLLSEERQVDEFGGFLQRKSFSFSQREGEIYPRPTTVQVTKFVSVGEEQTMIWGSFEVEGVCIGYGISEGDKLSWQLPHEIDNPEGDSWGWNGNSGFAAWEEENTIQGEEVPWGIKGELQSNESGLVYLRSRFYAPRWRLFISPDPEDPSPWRPQSSWAYCYCGDDPVNVADPGGTFDMLGSLMNLGCAVYSGLTRRLEQSLSNAMGGEVTQMMADYFESLEKQGENATVLVHGVGGHEWSYAAESLLRFRQLNRLANGGRQRQDFLPFVWSGFQHFGMLSPPYDWTHDVALRSLEYCMLCLKSYGYRKINLFSHSWGTVLTKDLLNAHAVTPGAWVTCGSPLPASHDSCFPLFGYDAWLNGWYPNDPVIQLRMEHPFPHPWGDCTGKSGLPLYQDSSGKLRQSELSTDSIWSHSDYWLDELFLKSCSSLWDAQ